MNKLLALFLLAIPFTAMAQSTKIKIKNLDKERAACWQQYAEGIKRQRQILPAILPPLSNGAHDTLPLPVQLESNAKGEPVDMNYFYGYKGAQPTAEHKSAAFIYLHGSGPRVAEWATGLKLCNMFNDSPSVYIIPQIPQEGEWYRWYQKSKQWAWDAMLRCLLARPDIDASRIYIFGISEGGYGSQRLASFYADYLAAAGPMAGGEPLKNAPAENLRHIAFTLRTGANDNGFYREKLTRYTAAALDSLQAATLDSPETAANSDSLQTANSDSLQTANSGDFRHWVELIPGRGHSIDYRPTPEYLRAFERRALPKHFSWEDYEMDGQHRTGFYYLAVDKRSNDTLRTRYDVSIEDNADGSAKVCIDVRNVFYTTTETDPRWGIELKFNRSYSTATGGRLTLFLDEHLINLKKSVTVFVNGKQLFSGRPRLEREALQRSIALWGDPLRMLPVAITLDY